MGRPTIAIETYVRLMVSITSRWSATKLGLLRNRSGATRLGFAVLLKFLLWHGRFPRALRELPDDAVAHPARQDSVSAGELAAFDLANRTSD